MRWKGPTERWSVGSDTAKENEQLCGHAGQMCDECDGDGPPNDGVWEVKTEF